MPRFDKAIQNPSDEMRRLNPELFGNSEQLSGQEKPDIETTPPSKQPNKTEQEYYDTFLAPRTDLEYIWFEALRFYLSNGHSYRPDWVAARTDNVLECHEVKGPRIHSRDSRVLYDTARKDYPCFEWFWAQKQNGKWTRR